MSGGRRFPPHAGSLPNVVDRALFEQLDVNDALAFAVGRFRLPEGLVYLDGNSLGPLPNNVAGVVASVVDDEWGVDLIRSWNANGWWELARRAGDRIAPLIGVPLGTVVAGDTTTVALYKAVGAARRLRPGRRVILTDRGNFPTDLYAIASVAEQFDAQMVMTDPQDVIARLGPDVAVLALTHVDYRTGRRHDMAELTDRAHAAGAVTVWDLSHSAGAMDVTLDDADLAVGCGYKYLNGGPGAPAFVYVHTELQESIVNPIAGWWGHEAPFAMEPGFRPAEGIARLQVGTQPILSLASLHAALEAFTGVDPPVLRAKSEKMTSLFIDLVDERLAGFEIVTPRVAAERGSHVSLAHPHAEAIMRTLIASQVIGDVRPPDLLRFGFSPIFQKYVDVWDAVERLGDIMDDGRWQRAPERGGPVT